MSDTEQEQGEDFTAPDPRDPPEGVDPETGVIEEQTPSEAAAAEGSAELMMKAAKATENYHKRIETVLGPDPDRHECPRCEGLGFVYGEEEAPSDLVHPDNLVSCDGCNGYGQVVTGSKAPGRETTVCIRCNGNGYRTENPQPENVTPIVPTATATLAPVMGFMTPEGVFQPLGQPNPAQGVG